MAEATPDKTTKKPKRRLRAAPTLREQTTAPQKPKKTSKLLTPFRLLSRGIGRLGRAIGHSRFGRTVRKVWKSKPLAPVRFIVKIISKVLFLSYFKNSFEELKGVTWPDNRTTWKLTFAVLVFALAFGSLIAGLDFVFEKTFREVILK